MSKLTFQICSSQQRTCHSVEKWLKGAKNCARSYNRGIAIFPAAVYKKGQSNKKAIKFFFASLLLQRVNYVVDCYSTFFSTFPPFLGTVLRQVHTSYFYYHHLIYCIMRKCHDLGPSPCTRSFSSINCWIKPSFGAMDLLILKKAQKIKKKVTSYA